MKTIINHSKKIVGMFSMMLALAVMLVGVSGASAARITPNGNPGPSDAYGKLTVYVSNAATGAQLSQATVAVYPQTSPSATSVIKGTTDARGEFASYVPVGTFKVVVSANGFNESSQDVVIKSGQGIQVKTALQPIASDPNPVPTPATTDPTSTSPVADGKLSVYAVNANRGSAIAQATVVVYDANGNVIAKELTDASGYFAMMVRPGTYKMQVTASGYATFGQSADVVPGEATVIKASLQSASDR